MAQGNPYARMVQSMRRQGAYQNGYDMQIGVVAGRDPLVIQIGEDRIEKGLYCSPMAKAGTETDQALDDLLEMEEQISEGLKVWLKDNYTAVRLDIGDQVLVQRVGNAFYICGKVVPV